MYSINLLSDKALVEAPFVKVDIGDYTFGVFQKSQIGAGSYRITYPNFIKALEIKKINGTVNQYTLSIAYPVTAESDPNFFEKVFSTVSDTRKIVFSYGDFSTPNYIYRDEEALITDVKTRVNISNSSIEYTISAVSSAAVSMSGTFTFTRKVSAKPSTVIREILYSEKYGLTEIFKGMQNRTKVETEGLIASDDAYVTIEAQSMSPLDYINYLVSCMKSNADVRSGSTNSTVYTMVINDDKDGLFGGSYFKISRMQRNANSLESTALYTIDIGYPSADLVTSFDITNQQGYSILYNYSGAVDSYNYGKRIDDNGQISYVQANPLTSSKQLHLTTERDKTWWTKVTEFPIQVKLTIRGLLRPAILMNYIKLNVWFYGRKHISSGYYIITAQTDRIEESSGFQTVLSLTRIAPDGDIDVAIGMFGENVTGQRDTIETTDNVSVNYSSKSTIKATAKGVSTVGEKYSDMGNTKLTSIGNVQVHTNNLTGNKIVIGHNDKGIVVGNNDNDVIIKGSGGGGSSGW